MAILAFILGIALFILSLPFSAVASANSLAVKISKKREEGAKEKFKKDHKGWFSRTALGRYIRGGQSKEQTKEENKTKAKQFVRGATVVAEFTKRQIFRATKILCKSIARLLRTLSMALTGLGVVASLIISLTVVAIFGGVVATITTIQDGATVTSETASSKEATDTSAISSTKWGSAFLGDVAEQMYQQLKNSGHWGDKDSSNNPPYCRTNSVKYKINGKTFSVASCCTGLVFGMLCSAGLVKPGDWSNFGRGANWRPGSTAASKKLKKFGSYITPSSFADLKPGDILIAKGHSHVQMFKSYDKKSGEVKCWNWGCGSYIKQHGISGGFTLSKMYVFRVNASDDSSSASTGTSPVKDKNGVTGKDVIAYANKFVGNPYDWGGTSLTNGADCSGFVMSVYKHFGYSLNHSSYADRTAGKAVDKNDSSKWQAGDLLCFSGHVALYDGHGKMVEAQSEKAGITNNRAVPKGLIAVRRVLK